MCKTPKIKAGAGAPPEGITPVDDVQVAERGGLRVGRSSLVNNLGFSRTSPQLLSNNTFGDAIASRFGFTAS